MGRVKRFIQRASLLTLVCMATFAIANANAAPATRVTRIAIVTGAQSTEVEQKAAQILKARILKRSAVSVEVLKEDDPNPGERVNSAEVVISIGNPAGNALNAGLMHDFHITLPTLPNSTKLHPEGFVVKSVVEKKKYIVIAGSDERGPLYGVGSLLRAMTFLPDAVLIPEVDVQDKPAFPIRGGRPAGPGSRARQYGNLRPQTGDEMNEVMEDLMLLGTNVFAGDPKQLHQYGMMTVFGRTANEMDPGFPKEWRADNGRAQRYVCPSIPEARKALLESFDKQFKEMPDYDFFETNSGDEGGCRCDKCMPWGDKYIRLVHDIADIMHKYHPNTKVIATNQDLTNEGNQAIFEYLNSADSSWLYAIRYGPGADEMQTYIRGAVNPRWFEYEGFGPLGNYLKYMYHELPRTTNIVLYSDITHWMQAQYAVPHPDVALAAVYDRRSWNARPNNFHKVAEETLHYALGDIHYSEGMHDDFNKWFWYRMMWDPNQSAESITKEYCRYWFGPDAQDDAAQAIFLMEETLEKPVVDNPGIAKAVDLLRGAKAKIPENLLKVDYRWRIMMEKALMDRYIQLELQHGRDMEKQAAAIFEHIDASQNPSADVAKALAIVHQPVVTAEMTAVLEEAKKVGEESNTIIGYREPAPFFVDKYDLSEVGYWDKVLTKAVAEKDDAKLRNTVKMLLHYDDPGKGGFYDDLGWPNDSKHLTHGEALWGFLVFPGPAKQSQYSVAYAFDPKHGVTFDYDGLDPQAQYVVRITAGGNRDEDQPAYDGLRLAEGISANGVSVAEPFNIPLDEASMFEFDIPKETTKSGKLQLELTPKAGGPPITAASEIWLMRKGSEPWTARP